MEMKPVYGAVMLVSIFFLHCFSAGAQDLSSWSKGELERANTAADVLYMTAEEKKALQLMNLARIDGKKFFNTYINDYISLHNAKYRPIFAENAYVISLAQDLEKIKDLPLLYPDESLCKAAAYHAEDLGRTGKTGHASTNGMSFSVRLEKFAGKRHSVSENISYGFADAVGIVFQLLIDEGVPSLGHRVNILRATDRFVGIAIRPHKKWDSDCVMDFSADHLSKR